MAEARERGTVLNERFANACSQIGHEKPTVRLYAMASLADEWLEQRQWASTCYAHHHLATRHTDSVRNAEERRKPRKWERSQRHV